MALETASTGIECPGLPAYRAHMVPPASQTPPAALHQPTLVIAFLSSSRIFSLPQGLPGSGLGRSVLGTYLPITKGLCRQVSLLWWKAGEREEGREEGKKRCVPTPFGPLARHLGFRNKSEKPIALEGHKVCWRQIE